MHLRNKDEGEESNSELLVEVCCRTKIFAVRTDDIDMTVWSCLGYGDCSRKIEHQTEF